MGGIVPVSSAMAWFPPIIKMRVLKRNTIETGANSSRLKSFLDVTYRRDLEVSCGSARRTMSVSEHPSATPYESSKESGNGDARDNFAHSGGVVAQQNDVPKDFATSDKTAMLSSPPKVNAVASLNYQQSRQNSIGSISMKTDMHKSAPMGTLKGNYVSRRRLSLDSAVIYHSHAA